MKALLSCFTRPFLSVIAMAIAVAIAWAGKQPEYLRHGSNNYQPPGNHNLTLKFRPMVDSLPLAFGKIYSNPFREPYSVRKFKFYLHAIELTDGDGKKEPTGRDSIYLIDFADTDRLATIKLSVPDGPYDRISFTVGVDSIYNLSGAQTGTLDPLHGMFWTWNTGYIVAKLEGNSPMAQTPNNAFAYHIGGFKGENNVVKRITLHFPPGKMLAVKEADNRHLIITANVNAWFLKPHQIHLSATPTCMTPGALSKQIADNYSNMFAVTNIMNVP